MAISEAEQTELLKATSNYQKLTNPIIWAATMALKSGSPSLTQERKDVAIDALKQPQKYAEEFWRYIIFRDVDVLTKSDVENASEADLRTWIGELIDNLYPPGV